MGSNTAGAGLGFVKYSVSPTEIDVQTDFTSTFQDSFSIVSPQAPLSASFAYSPTNPTVGNSESFTVTASGGTGPTHSTGISVMVPQAPETLQHTHMPPKETTPSH